MAVVLAHRPPMTQAGKSLLWAVAGFGVATVVFGLSTNPYLSFAMLFFTGGLITSAWWCGRRWCRC